MEAAEANIDILKTTIENMGNELFLYKAASEKQWENLCMQRWE